jgi:hypothetical protein
MADQQLTVFGATLLELMSKRGTRSWTALSALLAKGGYTFQPSRMSNWAYGRHAAAHEFVSALREVLQLDEEEAVHLAKAFAYDQEESAWSETGQTLRMYKEVTLSAYQRACLSSASRRVIVGT